MGPRVRSERYYPPSPLACDTLWDGVIAMPNINRREFSQLALALGASVRSFGGSASIDNTLQSGMQRRKIPAVTAVVATDSKITYQGAFGMRDSASGVKVAPDTSFAIASMT